MRCRVLVSEYLSRWVDVEADSLDEAEEIVERMYYKQQIVLGSEDFLMMELQDSHVIDDND